MKRTRAVLTVSAAVAGLALAVTGWAAAEEAWTAPARAARRANPVPANDESLAAGKALYIKNCLSCHGDAGKGNGPAAKDLEKSPGDLSKPAMWEQSDGAIFWKLSTGKKPMPTFETLTTETERWQIIDFMRTLAQKPATTSAPATAAGAPAGK
jgi:mono/diheme cytochrome c family protein